LAVEEPLEHRERVVRGDAVRVRAGTDHHAELLTGDDRWLATNRVRSLTFQHVVPGVVPRILNGPADSKSLHPCEGPSRRVIQVRDGPSKRRDREFAIDAFPDAEQLLDIDLAVPVHRHGQTARSRPTDDVVVLLLVSV